MPQILDRPSATFQAQRLGEAPGQPQGRMRPRPRPGRRLPPVVATSHPPKQLISSESKTPLIPDAQEDEEEKKGGGGRRRRGAPCRPWRRRRCGRRGGTPCASASVTSSRHRCAQKSIRHRASPPACAPPPPPLWPGPGLGQHRPRRTPWPAAAASTARLTICVHSVREQDGQDGSFEALVSHHQPTDEVPGAATSSTAYEDETFCIKAMFMKTMLAHCTAFGSPTMITAPQKQV